MKSWFISARDGALALERREAPIPQPAAGEILLRVQAAALNRGEFNPRYHADGSARIGGHEAAGVVEAVGAGVTHVKPGERVMGRAKAGFAEYSLMTGYEAMPVPARLSWEAAAGVPLVFLVTYDMLVRYGRLQPAEWLLVTAVSSGVGVACLQTARLLGARVIGTSGAADKLARLGALGLDAGLCTRAPDFAGEVRRLTAEHGADLIVNCVGGSLFGACLDALAYGGRFATVSTVDDVTRCELDIHRLHANRWTLFGASNRFNPPAQREAAVRGFVRDILPGFADGRIEPVVDSVFEFDALPAARDRMLANAHIGKIVLRVA